MTDAALSWLLPAIVALVPGAAKWLLDRRLAGRADDPALAERLMAQGQRLAVTVSVAAGIILWFWPRHLLWTAPLMLAAVAAAGFPLRRRLLGETWSLAAYSWFMVRLQFAVHGIWLLMMLAPVITNHAGWKGWASSIVFALLLLAWNERFGDVARWMLGAVPLEDAGVSARITELVGRTQLTMPRFDVVPTRGGVVANAAALPSLRRSSVLFMETILTRLTPDEIAAVAAHELAHLEQFHPRRLQSLRLSTAGLIVIATMLAPVLGAIGVALTWHWLAGNVALVLGYQTLVGRRQQQHETESDLRAVALTGDAEPMVSALVKLSVLARLPRRWDQSVESYASHPSLSRRIKAIREAMASTPVPLIDASTFDAADGSGRTVRFDDERVVWADASGSMHAIPYAKLSELRVRPGRGQAAELAAIDDEGRHWSLPLYPADVGRVQTVLDAVDVRVSYGRPPAAASPALTLTAMVAALIAGTSGQQAAGLLMLFATFDRSAPVTAAAGAASLATAVVVLRDGGASLLAPVWASPVALVLAAAYLLSSAWRTRHLGLTRRAVHLLAGMSVIVLMLFVPLALSSAQGLAWSQAARAFSGFGIAAAGLAPALMLTRSRWARVAGIAVAVAAVAAFAAGTTAAPERASVDHDPLIVDAPSAREVVLDGEPAAQIEFQTAAAPLLLSPGGEYVAVADGDSEHLRRFHVAKPGGGVRVFAADYAAFADDRTLMTSEQIGDAVVIRRIDLEADASPTEYRLAGVTQARFSVDASAGRWRLIGYEPDEALLSVEGSVVEGETSQARWDADLVRRLQPVAINGTSLIAIGITLPIAQRSAYWLWPLIAPGPSGFGPIGYSTRLWKVRDGSRVPLVDSKLAPRCVETASRVVCAAFDGRLTHVVGVATDTAAIGGLARLAQQFMPTEPQSGWIGGFTARGRAVALHVETATVVRGPEVAGEFVTAVTGTDRHVATLSVSDHTSTVRLYSLGAGLR